MEVNGFEFSSAISPQASSNSRAYSQSNLVSNANTITSPDTATSDPVSVVKLFSTWLHTNEAFHDEEWGDWIGVVEAKDGDDYSVLITCLCKQSIKVPANNSGGWTMKNYKNHVARKHDGATPPKRARLDKSSEKGPSLDAEAVMSMTTALFEAADDETVVSDSKEDGSEDEKHAQYKQKVEAAYEQYNKEKETAIAKENTAIDLTIAFEKFGVMYDWTTNGTILTCDYCRGLVNRKTGAAQFQLALSTCKSPALNLRDHLISRRHYSASKQRQTSMLDYVVSPARLDGRILLSEFANEVEGRLCIGWTASPDSDFETMIRDLPLSSVKTFSITNHVSKFMLKNGERLTKQHGIHSTNELKPCIRVSPFMVYTLPNMCCDNCRAVPLHNPEFVVLRNKFEKRDSLAASNTGDSKLCFSTLVMQRLKHTRGKFKALKLRNLIVTKALHAVMKKYEPFQQLKLDVPFHRFVMNSISARNDGKLSDNHIVMQQMTNYVANLLREKNGRRYTEDLKRVLAAAKIMGGEKAALITNMFLDMSSATWNRLLRKERVKLLPWLDIANFQTVKEMFVIIMTQLGIPLGTRILATLQMDESPIIKTVTVHYHSGEKSFEL